MPRKSRAQIYNDEQKVLKALQKNSNQGIDTIAKHCGFSRQKVWRIIKNLEKNEFIWGYTVVADDEKLELKRYLMLIKRSQKPIDQSIAMSMKQFADVAEKKNWYLP